MTSAFVDRDGLRIAYDERGAGTPPMVFVHGWCCDRSFFAPQMEHFSTSHRCIGVDLRGHGESEQSSSGYSIPMFADDIAALCVEVGAERPVLVGHSMGATVVLELAGRHPDLPAAVVMVDSAPLDPAATFGAFADAMLEALRGENDSAARAQFVDGMFIAADDSARRQRITEVMLGAPRAVALGAMEAILAWNGYQAATAAAGVPVLAIAARSRTVPELLRLREFHPSVTVGLTVGAGHFNQLEVPDQVNSMIERFLVVNGLAT